MKKQYMISGKTYDFKEELKARGCKWDDVTRVWITPSLEKDSETYKAIERLAEVFNCNVTSLNLDEKGETIRGILNDNR